jgi:(p)ppGpp synthase/HD superfamily hydrolase
MFTKDEICARLAQKRAQGELLDAGYNLACFIASASLIAQKDKTNEDYAHHFLRVSRDNTDSVAKMIIGILHDVVEDTDWTLDDLRAIGFSERIVLGIEGVTHKDGELYFDSIERCVASTQIPSMLNLKITTIIWRNHATRFCHKPKT